MIIDSGAVGSIVFLLAFIALQQNYVLRIKSERDGALQGRDEMQRILMGSQRFHHNMDGDGGRGGGGGGFDRRDRDFRDRRVDRGRGRSGYGGDAD